MIGKSSLVHEPASLRRGQVHYRSARSWSGLPLVDISLGGRDHDGRYRVGYARGVIAIGDVAVGLVAIGGVAIGLLSLGGLAVGLVALAGAALGVVAVGGAAVGVTAVGALALGLTAHGAVTWSATAATPIGRSLHRH